jgi:hypothetical protein
MHNYRVRISGLGGGGGGGSEYVNKVICTVFSWLGTQPIRCICFPRKYKNHFFSIYESHPVLFYLIMEM